MINEVKAFQKTIKQSSEWVRELQDSYTFTDENKAFVLMRATLKALRDRISPGEAHHLGSQLPALIRGFYYEGWDPDKKHSRDRTVDDFLDTVRFHLGGHDDIDLEMSVPEVLRIVFEKIGDGEAEEVKHNLPKDIQQLCP